MPTPLPIKVVISAVDRITGPLRQITSRVGRSAALLSAPIGKIGAAFASASKWAVASGAVVGAAAAKITHDYVESASAIKDLTAQLGVNAEAYQAWKFAAGQAGVEGESFDTALQVMTRNLGNLKAKTGPMFAMLSKVAPKLRDSLAKAKPDEALDQIVRAMEKIPDPTKRAALAQAVFGRGGASMIRLAVEGSASLAKLREEARLLGIVLSEEDIEAAETFGDNLDRMKLSLVGVANSIIRRFVPDMDEGVKGITEWIVQNRELIATKVEAAIRKVGEYLQKIGDWFVAHKDEIRRVFVDGFDLAARAVTTIGENIDLVIAAVKTLAITWVAGKLVGGFNAAIEAATKLRAIWQGMPGFGTPGTPTSNAPIPVPGGGPPAPIPVPGGGPPAPTGKWQGLGKTLSLLPAAGAGYAIGEALAPELRRMAEERFGAGKQWAVTDAILGDKAILGGIDRLRAIAEHGTRVETVVTFNNAPPGMVVDSVTTNGAPAAAQVNVNRGDSRMATGAP